jgi:uncharacterized protein (DUF342 family)
MKTILSKETDYYKISCLLSDDGLKLFLNLTPKINTNNIESIKDRLEDEICKILEEVINPDLIDIEVLRDTLQQLLLGKTVLERRIAKGTPAVNGRDGKLLFLVKKLSKEPELKSDEKGNVDLKELNFFDNIEIGQAVARIYPPHNGVDGSNALGQKIPAKPGNPTTIKTDDSLEIQKESENDGYLTIKSKKIGYLLQNANLLSISDELIINNNIDYKTGNINFIGNIKIRGDVQQGFNVKARGNIEINGNLYGGNLESLQGSVIVTKLAVGAENTYIRAAQDININLVQDYLLEASNTIKITKECRNCNAYTKTFMELPDASLVGGVAHVVCGLSAKEIGNDTGVTTIIEISSDLEMSKEYQEIQNSIIQHERALELVKLHLGPFAQNPKRIVFLKKELRDKIEKLLSKYEQLNQSLAKLNSKKNELLKASRYSKNVRISFSSIIYGGTNIISAEQEFEIKEPMKGPATIQFDHTKKQFHITEHSAVICEFPNTIKDNQKENINE